MVALDLPLWGVFATPDLYTCRLFGGLNSSIKDTEQQCGTLMLFYPHQWHFCMISTTIRWIATMNDFGEPLKFLLAPP